MESRIIIDSFFKENTLVKHHIDSYNNFIENGIQKIIDEVGLLKTEVKGGYKVKGYDKNQGQKGITEN